MLLAAPIRVKLGLLEFSTAAMYAESLRIHPERQFLDPKQLKSVKRMQIHAHPHLMRSFYIHADDRSTSTSTSFAIWFDLDLISFRSIRNTPVSYTHLRAHET